MTLAPLPADYGPWLADLKQRIQGARTRAVLAAAPVMKTGEQIRLTIDLGREILARQATQGWGAKVIDRLAQDLRAAFPDMNGRPAHHLMCMPDFAQAYPDPAIRQQPAAQLASSLLTNCADPSCTHMAGIS